MNILMHNLRQRLHNMTTCVQEFLHITVASDYFSGYEGRVTQQKRIKGSDRFFKHTKILAHVF